MSTRTEIAELSPAAVELLHLIQTGCVDVTRVVSSESIKTVFTYRDPSGAVPTAWQVPVQPVHFPFDKHPHHLALWIVSAAENNYVDLVWDDDDDQPWWKSVAKARLVITDKGRKILRDFWPVVLDTDDTPQETSQVSAECIVPGNITHLIDGGTRIQVEDLQVIEDKVWARADWVAVVHPLGALVAVETASLLPGQRTVINRP